MQTPDIGLSVALSGEAVKVAHGTETKNEKELKTKTR